jgi:hypothetical protein
MAAYKMPHNRIENLISIAVLLLLVTTAVLIFMKQFRYDPSIFPSGMMPSDSSEKPSLKNNSRSPVSDATVSSDASVIPVISAAGMVPMSPSESFNKDNLSEKINGKAELYLSAGFRNLVCQRLKKQDDPDLWFEVFIYDMGNIENAFAVYSVQKRDGLIPLEISEYSYKTENALFFVSGLHYVEITSSKVSAFLMNSMLSFSNNFIRKTGAGKIRIPDTELFPKENLDENSIILFPSNAFSFDLLNMVFAADYKTEKGRIKAFLSRRKNKAEADEIAKSYSDFLSSLGGREIKPDPDSGNMRIIEIMDAYEMIFTNGPFLAGIHSADDLKKAKELAMALDIKLGENTGVK